MTSEDDSEVTAVGDECAVIGSPLKLHNYLADLQPSSGPSLTSNIVTAFRQPVSLSDARCAMIIFTVIITVRNMSLTFTGFCSRLKTEL